MISPRITHVQLSGQSSHMTHVFTKNKIILFAGWAIILIKHYITYKIWCLWAVAPWTIISATLVVVIFNIESQWSIVESQTQYLISNEAIVFVRCISFEESLGYLVCSFAPTNEAIFRTKSKGFLWGTQQPISYIWTLWTLSKLNSLPMPLFSHLEIQYHHFPILEGNSESPSFGLFVY